MIVMCPKCKRQYELDESLMSSKGAMGKCKPCGSRFLIEPAGKVIEPGDLSLDTKSWKREQ